MKKIKNITGDPNGAFPIPQTLAYVEKGRGNVPEYKDNPKKKDYVYIKAGEEIETSGTGDNIGGEPRLVFIDDTKSKKKGD